jgi:hypothetical protein
LDTVSQKRVMRRGNSWESCLPRQIIDDHYWNHNINVFWAPVCQLVRQAWSKNT